jgi:GR25 family glycosyltransferase involved in LPS biosynthesis
MHKNNIILFIILLFVIFIVELYKNKEPFVYNSTIDFYVITMKNEDRLKNIENQIQKQMNIMNTNDNKNNENNSFDFSIQKVDAVVGKNIDIHQLIQQNKIDPNILNENIEDFNKNIDIKKREIGCYLSHLKTYELIKLKNKTENYSVILEDDFKFTDDFMYKLEDTIINVKKNNIDFDFLFLGILGYNGDHIMDNSIFTVPSNSFGTHGYLINNKNIDKIIKKLSFIDCIIDVQIFRKGENKELNVARIDPVIIDTGDFYSEIRL